MTVFVTGSESFIGGFFIEKCQEFGFSVVGIDSVVSGNSVNTQADIRDPGLAALIPEEAIVVHLAAISRDPDCRADPKSAFDINVTGTLNVAHAARQRHARQLIFASSEWVYGDVANSEVQLEDRNIDVTAINSEYALSKIVAEQLLKLSFSDLPTTVLRFGIVYGPRPVLASAVEHLFDAVRSKDTVTVGALATARRFIHVRDIASGILASFGRDGFEIFNLSGDRPISLGEVIDASCEFLEREVEIIEKAPNEPSIRNPDNSKARTAFNWKPEIDLMAGLSDLARSAD